MSENTAPETTPENSVTPPPSASPVRAAKNSRRRLRLKLTGLVVVCLLLLAGAIWGSDLVWRDTHHEKESGIAKNGQLTPKATKEQTAQKADTLAYSGNYAAAKALLDSAVSKAETPTEKVYYQSKAVAIALNAGKMADAYAYAKEEYKTMPTSATAFAVGQGAQINGDYVTAKKYIQMAIDMLDKSKPGANITLNGYQAVLKEVSQ